MSGFASRTAPVKTGTESLPMRPSAVAASHRGSFSLLRSIRSKAGMAGLASGPIVANARAATL